MKKNITIVIAIVLALIICIACSFLIKTFLKNTKQNNLQHDPPRQLSKFEIDCGGVKYNGWLKTEGSVLKNEKGDQIQLRGVSSHALDWYSDVITYENLEYLKNEWNINVFRIAMYTDVGEKGYINTPEQTKKKVFEIADMAIDLDMYVIVDWHILEDNNPQKYKNEAIKFFTELSDKYKNTPNIIYEICNEPNGTDVKWENSVKPYAEEVIPYIRKNAPQSLIIVGTPKWCTDLIPAANNPLKFDNIVYACHFYSGTHGNDLRQNIDIALNKNIPIFISECGLTNNKGNGILYDTEFRKWIDYLNSKNISWIYWSFSNKEETSAIIKPEYTAKMNNKNEQSGESEDRKNDLEDYLTDAGKIIKDLLKEW